MVESKAPAALDEKVTVPAGCVWSPASGPPSNAPSSTVAVHVVGAVACSVAGAHTTWVDDSRAATVIGPNPSGSELAAWNGSCSSR